MHAPLWSQCDRWTTGGSWHKHILSICCTSRTAPLAQGPLGWLRRKLRECGEEGGWARQGAGILTGPRLQTYLFFGCAGSLLLCVGFL